MTGDTRSVSIFSSRFRETFLYVYFNYSGNSRYLDVFYSKKRLQLSSSFFVILDEIYLYLHLWIPLTVQEIVSCILERKCSFVKCQSFGSEHRYLCIQQMVSSIVKRALLEAESFRNAFTKLICVSNEFVWIPRDEISNRNLQNSIISPEFPAKVIFPW